MKSIQFILSFLVLCFSCEVQSSQSIPNKIQEYEHNNVPKIERSSGNKGVSSIVEGKKDKIINCEEITYILTHEIKEGEEDPLDHYIKVVSGKDIILQEIFYSSDVDDVKLIDLEELSCLVVIEYYSSSVGYLEYYVFDLDTRQMYKTEKLDETEQLIISSINLREGVMETNIGERRIIRDSPKRF